MIPRLLIVRLTEGCNAGCFMCSFARKPVTYSFSVDEALKVGADPNFSSIVHVRFTGGEPLLLPHLEDLVATFRELGVAVSIITNGWYLADRVKSLVEAGLGQVILSLDGASAQSHDRFRKTEGLFDRLVHGAHVLKSLAAPPCLRVNSVIGPHNIDEVEAIHRVNRGLRVDQWSIIPLKRPDRIWDYPNHDRFRSRYRQISQFLSQAAAEGQPQLLGHSATWAGRDEVEIERFLTQQVAITPKDTCDIVRNVLYYVPEERKITLCNCLSHRELPFDVMADVENGSLLSPELDKIGEWLHINAPKLCKGCEPINAAFNEEDIDLTENPFAF